jgi:hypothetical protein
MDQICVYTTSQYQLIRFFVSLLLHSRPSNPVELFTRYLDRMLPPHVPDRANDYELRKQRLLRQIQRQLLEANKTMLDFGLPEPVDTRTVAERVEADLIQHPIDPDTGEQHILPPEDLNADALEDFDRCTDSQKEFISRVFDMYETYFVPDGYRQPWDWNPSRCFLLQGAAGTGKTFTLDVLIKLCAVLGVPIRACASTGHA